jgi:hypothetical protein
MKNGAAEGGQSRTSLLIAPNEMQRPKWLTLNGQRYPFPISTELCRRQSPCAISARYIDESADATPGDSYAFFEPYASSKLYLYPGRYRLSAWNVDGKSISEQVIQINGPAVSRSTRNIVSEPCHRLLRQAEDVRCTPVVEFGSHGACAVAC